jgi:ppGpp synthetase/RelA/SpoT-type nucleotidyltranferase
MITREVKRKRSTANNNDCVKHDSSTMRRLSFATFFVLVFLIQQHVFGLDVIRNSRDRQRLPFYNNARLQFSATELIEEKVINCEIQPPLINGTSQRQISGETSSDLSAAHIHSARRRTKGISAKSGLLLPPDPKDLLATEILADMPPWLRITDEITNDQVENEVAWLEYSLLEHGFSTGDIADIEKTIRITGDAYKIVGCIAFCKLILRLEEPGAEDRIFATKEVLLASIIHYAECVTARQEGVYQQLERLVTGTSSPAASLGDINKQGTSLVSDSFRLQISEIPLLEDFRQDKEVLRLAGGAALIKRAEILADVVLMSDGRALTKAEYSDVRNLLLSIMEDWRALAIRVVASLYRLDGILIDVERGASQYMKRNPEAIHAAREALQIYANLAQRLGMQRLKMQLEAAAFRILYPRQFNAASSLFRQNGVSMQAVSDYVSSQVEHMLFQDQSLMSQVEDIQITSRVKEPYSFWKKLLQKRLLDGSKSKAALLSPSSEILVTEVHDGVALRVVVRAQKWSRDESDESLRSRERLLCYYIQHLIRRRFPASDESRIKDYISSPKANGYQSLHYTSSITRRNQKFPFEVQVRSEQMHRIAEFGVAAHFDYKLGVQRQIASSLPPARGGGGQIILPLLGDKMDADSGFSVIDPVELGRVRQRSNEAGESAYIDALVTARKSLVRSHVYVFLAGSSNAKLLSLPAGASVSDVIAELDNDISLGGDTHELRVSRNGRMAHLDEILLNGDVVLIFSQCKPLIDHSSVSITR